MLYNLCIMYFRRLTAAKYMLNL